ncbi:MAG: phycobiliprotein lyase [Spirulinaceae cyanobacterium]
MDIKEFFEQSAGNWFAQRTSYNLKDGKAENSKSDLSTTLLAADDPRVVKLCQEKGISQDLVWQGIKTSWDSSVDWDDKKEKGSSLIVIIPDADNSSQGKILRSLGKLLAGRYILGRDEALTLTVENEDIYFEERIWFASNNLRMRSSLIKMADTYNGAAFYSEVRRMPAKDK